jgi:hypothetical protein
MVVGVLTVGKVADHRRYVGGRKRFPVTLTPVSHQDHLFNRAKGFKDDAPRGRKGPWKSWISEETWRLVDKRADGRRTGILDSDGLRAINKLISKAFRTDRKRRMEAAGAEIENKLRSDDPKAAWGTVKTWYRFSGGKPPKPARADLAEITEEYRELGTRRDLPVAHLPVRLNQPFVIEDDVPTETEIACAVQRLRPGKAPGPSGIRADDLKTWLNMATREENPDRSAWENLVKIVVQRAFETGDIPTALQWGVLVLIPKSEAGKFRGIGLLEVIWKLITTIINKRLLQGIEFHPAIHGFRRRRGTGTAVLECKLLMSMAHKAGKPLYQIFIDFFSKAYPSMDRGRTLEILEGYGVGLRTLRIFRNY